MGGVAGAIVMQEVKGSHGGRQSLAEPVVGLRTGVIDGPRGPKVELVASMGAHRATGSDMAMHMDVEVARSLFVQLRDTFAKMSWPLPK